MNVSDHNKILYEDLFSNNYELSHLEKIKNIIKLIDNKPKRVLDVGCGDGWVGALIKKEFGSEVHGMDILDKALIKAKKNGLITKKFDLSKSKWPYKNNYFDLIIAGDIIEHIYDTDNFVKECRRVLKKGGKLIVSIPNINSYLNRLLILIGKYPLYVDYSTKKSIYKYVLVTGHVKVFNKKTITRLLADNSFKIDKIKGSYFVINKELFKSKLNFLTSAINQ